MRAKHHNVCTRSYVEVYRGKIGANKHLFAPHNSAEKPLQTPPHQQQGEFGACRVKFPVEVSNILQVCAANEW
jgi:hypothetical protein